MESLTRPNASGRNTNRNTGSMSMDAYSSGHGTRDSAIQSRDEPISGIHHWVRLGRGGKVPRQETPLKPVTFYAPKKDSKTGVERYDSKVHPTTFSSKEIGELHHIVNGFAHKLRGRRRVSWRMIKRTMETRQHINGRKRTRYELMQVYSKTFSQCDKKKMELNFLGLSETSSTSKKHKKSKKNPFWDARFIELAEKKGRGNKKLFKEPVDFDDKKLNQITKKFMRKMVKELEVCMSRVVDLTPDNQNKEEHASHQQTIQSAYSKLNLQMQGQKPYAPNYIWKNHWGGLPVNPYINAGGKSNGAHTSAQQAISQQQHHPAMRHGMRGMPPHTMPHHHPHHHPSGRIPGAYPIPGHPNSTTPAPHGAYPSGMHSAAAAAAAGMSHVPHPHAAAAGGMPHGTLHPGHPHHPAAAAAAAANGMYPGHGGSASNVPHPSPMGAHPNGTGMHPNPNMPARAGSYPYPTHPGYAHYSGMRGHPSYGGAYAHPTAGNERMNLHFFVYGK